MKVEEYQLQALAISAKWTCESSSDTKTNPANVQVFAELNSWVVPSESSAYIQVCMGSRSKRGHVEIPTRLMFTAQQKIRLPLRITLVVLVAICCLTSLNSSFSCCSVFWPHSNRWNGLILSTLFSPTCDLCIFSLLMIWSFSGRGRRLWHLKNLPGIIICAKLVKPELFLFRYFISLVPANRK